MAEEWEKRKRRTNLLRDYFRLAFFRISVREYTPTERVYRALRNCLLTPTERDGQSNWDFRVPIVVYVDRHGFETRCILITEKKRLSSGDPTRRLCVYFVSVRQRSSEADDVLKTIAFTTTHDRTTHRELTSREEIARPNAFQTFFFFSKQPLYTWNNSIRTGYVTEFVGFARNGKR